MNFSNIVTPFDYTKAAFLAREAAKEMLGRLSLMKQCPEWIVDVGCGAGDEVKALSAFYPQAHVCGIDVAQAFLQYGREQMFGKTWIAADGGILPLRSHSVDMIFSNLLLPWCAEPASLLREWRRVLRPHGLLLLSCLGPHTFSEWTALLGDEAFLPKLVDMHNVGDALLAEGFIDPVMEVEEITLTFRSQEQLQEEMEKSGMMVFSGSDIKQYTVSAVTFEVIYGHAWCPAVKGFVPDEQGEVKIPLSQLKK